MLCEKKNFFHDVTFNYKHFDNFKIHKHFFPPVTMTEPIYT